MPNFQKAIHFFQKSTFKESEHVKTAITALVAMERIQIIVKNYKSGVFSKNDLIKNVCKIVDEL